MTSRIVLFLCHCSFAIHLFTCSVQFAKLNDLLWFAYFIYFFFSSFLDVIELDVGNWCMFYSKVSYFATAWVNCKAVKNIWMLMALQCAHQTFSMDCMQILSIFFGQKLYCWLLWFLSLQGTNIAAGKCRGVVIGTGLATEIGEHVVVVVVICVTHQHTSHLLNMCMKTFKSLKTTDAFSSFSVWIVLSVRFHCPFMCVP